MVGFDFIRKGLHTAFAFGTMALLAGCPEKRSRAEPTPAASAAPTAAGSRPREPLPLGVPEACASICERSQLLKCKNADRCLVDCVAEGTGAPCSAEFQDFYRCLVPQPAHNWECSEDGLAAIKPGFCEQQQERAVKCMEAKAQP